MNDRTATLATERPDPALSSEDAKFAADLPLTDLFRRFSSDVTTLIADEMALARAEFADKAPRVQQTAGLFGAATLLGLGAFIALTLTFIGLLMLVMPLWGAALIVTVAYAGGAAIAGLRGKAGLQDATEPLPRVAGNLKADFASLKAGFERGR